MSLEDPFLIVKNEVLDALNKLRNNFARWTELQSNPNELSRDDYLAFVNELKNGLKSIQWDLDELEESLENSDRSTILDGTELQKRKLFINQSREEIKSMNEQIIKGNTKFKKVDYSINFGSQQFQTGTKYYRLINEPETSNLSKNYDEEEHKSPYVPNHSITLDETEHSVNVINARHSEFDGLKQFWSSIPKKQKIAAGFVGIVILILMILFL